MAPRYATSDAMASAKVGQMGLLMPNKIAVAMKERIETMKLAAIHALYFFAVCWTSMAAIGRPQCGHDGAASETCWLQSGQATSAIAISSPECARPGVYQ